MAIALKSERNLSGVMSPLASHPIMALGINNPSQFLNVGEQDVPFLDHGLVLGVAVVGWVGFHFSAHLE